MVVSDSGFGWSVRPDFAIHYTSSILMVQGNYNDAINFLDSICSITLCDNLCNLNLFLAHSFLSQYDQAIKYFNPLRDDRMLPMTFDSLLFAFNYKELGEEQDAKLILDNNVISLETNLTQNKDFFTFLQLSMTHALLDEKEKSMKYLSDAIELGSAMGWHDLLPICPIYKNYWDDPEFKALVRKAQEERAAKRKQVEEMIESGEIDL